MYRTIIRYRQQDWTAKSTSQHRIFDIFEMKCVMVRRTHRISPGQGKRSVKLAAHAMAGNRNKSDIDEEDHCREQYSEDAPDEC